MPLPDVRMRLTGALPRVLLVDTNGAKLRDIRDALAGAGAGAIVLDPSAVPSDSGRIIVRTLEWEPGDLVFHEGFPAGNSGRVPLTELRLFQRGFRYSEQIETTKSREKRLALGRAVLTGGAIMTKTVTTTTTTAAMAKEGFIVIHRSDGGPELILYENRMDFGFLGSGMQPSRLANLQKTAAWLKGLAPGVTLLERLLEPGLVRGLPPLPVDPADLMIRLLYLDHEAGKPPDNSLEMIEG